MTERKRHENWRRHHSDVEPGIKDWGKPLETEKSKKIDFPLEPSKCSSANPCENDNPRELTVRNQMCVVLSHRICGNLLQQQQETDTKSYHFYSALLEHILWES